MKKNFLATIAIAGNLFFGSAIADEYRMVRSFYSTDKAHDVGDLITVVIAESTRSSKSESLSTEKSMSNSALNPFRGSQGQDTNDVSDVSNFINQLATLNNIAINASSQFDGSGSGASSESFETEMTARVVDKLENGTMVIRGERKVKMRGESVSIVISGIIRKRDITRENKIDSTRIADASVFYETSGTVAKGSRPGFMWRLFQSINPF